MKNRKSDWHCLSSMKTFTWKYLPEKNKLHSSRQHQNCHKLNYLQNDFHANKTFKAISLFYWKFYKSTSFLYVCLYKCIYYIQYFQIKSVTDFLNYLPIDTHRDVTKEKLYQYMDNLDDLFASEWIEYCTKAKVETHKSQIIQFFYALRPIPSS